MRHLVIALVLAIAAALPVAAQDDGRLLYADFEQVEGGRPVSSRGGLVQLTSYAENETRAPVHKGLAGASPPAPELVRLKADDANRAAAFDYELLMPNGYAGVALEVEGRPAAAGVRPADDVSGFKYIQLDVFATGVAALRLELFSRGHGIELQNGYPQATFKVLPGLNTYKIKLDTFRQPAWAQKVSVKDVRKNLTSMSITVYCERCTPASGTVVVDNIAFTN